MKNKKVVLTYAWGTPNAGDHALTMGALELITRMIPEDEITVISRFSSKLDKKDPTKDILDKYPNIEVIESPFKFSRATFIERTLEKVIGLIMMITFIFFPKLGMILFKNNKAIASIVNARFVLCNGGNLFYWNEHRKSLPRLLALIFPFIIAKNNNVKYGFLPQTMGPIENKKLLNFFKKILESSEFVLFREEKSFNYMKNILDTKKVKIELFPDLAFFISEKYKTFENEVNLTLKKLDLLGDEKFLSVTLRASKLGDPEGVTGENVDRTDLNKVTTYLKEMIIPVAEKNNLSILIVEQTDVDEETSKYFQKLLEENTKQKIRYLYHRDPLFLSLIYLKSQCLVGMRLHSLIFSLRVNTLAFAVYLKQFGPKTPGIYNDFALGKFCVDLDEISVNDSIDRLNFMLDNKVALEKSIEDHLKIELEREYKFVNFFIK
jgi:polysaccharide pyruvyl transferase WcaK-like protein